MKRFLSITVLLICLLGCSGVAPASDVSKTDAPPVPTEAAIAVAASTAPASTPMPVPTATPVPTDTPAPTPTPSPTPVPFDAEAETRMREAMMLDTASLTLVSTNSNFPSILTEPSADAKRITPFVRTQGVWFQEWIVLDTVERTKTYYRLKPVGADGEGYLETRSVSESRLMPPESPYAMLVRPNGLIYSARTLDSRVVAHASYSVVRVLGIDEKGFAAILTPDGHTGYVELGQIRYLNEDEFNLYLHQACETSDAVFDRETLVELAGESVDAPFDSAADFLYETLKKAGLHFNEGYYRFYQKPLGDETLYPKHLYIDPIYNSLLFKLFNSAGDLVTANGAETEWAYIDSLENAERGDLLFFSNGIGKGDAVIPNAEVVVHGRYSGDLSDCALYLGEKQMLTVRSGVVTEVTMDELDEKVFDSARRISPSVTDPTAHFIECMISAIYDRLGTPYHSFRRVGDASYDCSGIINWVLRGYDYDRTKTPSEIPLEITATAFGHLEELYSPTMRMTFVDTKIPSGDPDRLSELKRGDLVLLLNEKRSKIGHIMVYLGDNTVIHSTRIDSRYQGTLVAKFRRHLQSLYTSSRRIESIVPIN